MHGIFIALWGLIDGLLGVVMQELHVGSRSIRSRISMKISVKVFPRGIEVAF